MLSRERAGEEERLLRHEADLAAVLGQVERADVAAVDQQLAALELVEARDQARHAALARAGVADQRHRLPRPDVQGEVGQHDLAAALLLRVGRVGEVDVLEAHIAGQPASTGSRGGLHHLRLGVDQREDALGRGQAVLELAPEGGDADQRPPEEADRLHEQVPVAGRDAVRAARRQAAEVDQHGDADARRMCRGSGRCVSSVRPRRSPRRRPGGCWPRRSGRWRAPGGSSWPPRCR